MNHLVDSDKLINSACYGFDQEENMKTETLTSLHLLNHPFYQDWMAGRLTAAQLKDYACQYYTHVDAFPRYLGAVHSLCENSTDRKVILENLNDEEGTGFDLSHPELWLQFAEGMGAGRDEVLGTSPRGRDREGA
jgi:pyrroloquinoline-quinone synthase